MRKIIYHIAASVDGFIAHKDGSVSGFFMEGPHAEAFVQALNSYDTVIMGRGTYEFGFQYGLKPGQPAYKGLKHLIFSTTLQFESNDKVQLIAANELDFIQDIKRKDGKDIWLCGGGHLAGFLLNHGLLDELCIKVNPIILGKGIKLFENLTQQPQLKHFDTETYANGVILQRYSIQNSQSSFS